MMKLTSKPHSSEKRVSVEVKLDEMYKKNPVSGLASEDRSLLSISLESEVKQPSTWKMLNLPEKTSLRKSRDSDSNFGRFHEGETSPTSSSSIGSNSYEN
jgi:hypothetical protein